MKDAFKKSVLSNGVRVLTETVPGVHSVSVGVWVTLGSRDELPEDSGIAHFIEHMIFKGTETRSALDIAKAFDRMGGLSNAFTSKETTCFHAKVLDRHLDEVLELLSDIFLHSRFDPVEVERERQVILQEIKMVEDSPEDLVHELFCQGFWPDNGLGRSILGSAETVGCLGSESLKGFVHRAYVGPKVLVVAAGKVEHEDFAEKVRSLFAAVPKADGYSSRIVPRAKLGSRFHARDLEQVHMLMGFNCVNASDPRRYAALLMNVLLGGSMSSMLFQEIRERRGLAYAVYSFLTAYQDAGLLGVYAAVSRDKVAEVAELMLACLESLARAPVTRTALNEARDHVKGGLLLSCENTDSRMSRLAKNEINLGTVVSLDEVVRFIDGVTPEEVSRMARACLDEGGALTCLGPVGDDQAARCQDLLKSLQPSGSATGDIWKAAVASGG